MRDALIDATVVGEQLLATGPARRCETAADPARADLDETGIAQAISDNRQGSPRFTEGQLM